MKGTELLANIIWLPATCDTLGGNYIIAILVALTIGLYKQSKIRQA